MSLAYYLIIGIIVIKFSVFLFQARRKRNHALSYYLEQAVKETAKTVDIIKQEYIKKIEEAKQACRKAGKHVPFMLWYRYDWKIVSANAGVPLTICITPSWIPKLSSEDPRWQIAFLHTIGHELGHKTHDPFPSLLPTRKKFKNWVRECRADFYGLRFVNQICLVDYNVILNAIRFKYEENYKVDSSVATENNCRPDYEFRFSLLDNALKNDHRTFDANTINKIAEQAGFTDSKYINKMIKRAKL